MRRSCKTFAALGALLASFASPGALAQEPDVRDIAPFVMLVVDSSGSMEELPACTCHSESDCTNCRPKCSLPNDVFGEPPKDLTTKQELKKNRWAVTLEALTGKFVDFQCTPLDRTTANGMTYDEGYTVQYNQPWRCASPGTACPFNGTQVQNGILDSYVETLRFGLMTFDGEYTYKGGDDLLNEHEYDTTLATGMPGMWSYGGEQPFKYPGCTDVYYVDSGARGEAATEGALVSLNSENCASPPCDQYELNATIQETLLRTRPYGGTPIAASLTDLYEHLKNDITDTYAECRKKYAILITDGEPDPDFRNLLCHCGDEDPIVPCPLKPDGTQYDPAEFMCPYPLAKDAARKLVAGDGSAANPKQLEKLFVLGMSVQDADAREILDDIAEAGNTTAALQADDPNTLRATLDSVFSPLLTPISRSVPGFATGLTGTQYQISTGFQVSTSSLSSTTAPPWSGLIERRQFICNSTTGLLETPDIEDSDRFHEVLNNQSNLRKLYTALPEDPTPEKLVRKLARGSTEACDTTGCDLYEITHSNVSAAVYDVANDTARQQVYNWMYGASSTVRNDRKLGDIYHSSPTLIGPPSDEPADDAYTRFRDRAVVRERPLVLYIATNDGILHAISVEDYPVAGYPLTVNSGESILDIRAGEEFWGFIPPMLMPKLKDQLTAHQFNLDATPVVKDVFFKRESTEETEYHTVLIMGMRKGGNGYFALDVTDPVKPPKFLWQFTDDDMGLTYGQPEIVQATFLWPPESPTLQTRAVAILPGGVGTKGSGPGCAFSTTQSKKLSGGQPFSSWTADDRAATIPKEHRSAVQCWQRKGRSLYFVDVETGRQIKKVFDGDDDAGNGIWFPSPVTGTPTAYQDAVGTIADRGFVIDADGVVWRIDMSAQDPFDGDPTRGWVVRPFHDVFYDKRGTGKQGPEGGETTYERPILSLDEQRRVVVILGTGDTDDFEKIDADNRIVSLTEVTSTDDPDEPADYHALINWELRNEGTGGDGRGLYPGELVTGSMALFAGQLFAATFITNAGGGDACEYGRGRLWSVDYRTKDPGHTYSVLNDYGIIETPVTRGPMLIPVPVEDGVDSDAALFNVPRDRAEPNLLIQGLGTTQRMTCSVADDALNSYFAPQLANIEQTEPPAIWVVAQASGGSQRGASGLGGIQAKVNPRITFSRVTSWASSVD